MYRAHGARIERALIASFGDAGLAGDSTAQAFVELLGHRGVVRDPAAWVWSAAYAIARRHATTRALTYGLTPPDDGERDAADVIDVLEALRVLSPMQRHAVVLHHYAGWPVRDIADALGSSTSAVKVHLFRARSRLRSTLEEVLTDG